MVFWETLIATAAGATIALVGSVITLQLGLKNKKNDFMRTKAEELYTDICAWEQSFSYYHLSYYLGMRTNTSPEDISKTAKIGETKNDKVNINHVKMLIDVYFPNLNKTYNKLLKSRDKILDLVTCYISNYPNGTEELATYYNELADEFDKDVTVFKEELSEVIQDYR